MNFYENSEELDDYNLSFFNRKIGWFTEMHRQDLYSRIDWFCIDKKGRNGVTIALEKENMSIINNIVKYAGNKTDIQGNTILHYAARISSKEVVSKLLAFGLDTGVKNVSGDTAYVIATRWKPTLRR